MADVEAQWKKHHSEGFETAAEETEAQPGGCHGPGRGEQAYQRRGVLVAIQKKRGLQETFQIKK